MKLYSDPSLPPHVAERSVSLSEALRDLGMDISHAPPVMERWASCFRANGGRGMVCSRARFHLQNQCLSYMGFTQSTQFKYVTSVVFISKKRISNLCWHTIPKKIPKLS